MQIIKEKLTSLKTVDISKTVKNKIESQNKNVPIYIVLYTLILQKLGFAVLT